MTDTTAARSTRPPILPQSASAWFWLLAKLGVSGAILAVSFSRIEFDKVGDALRHLNLWIYGAAVAAAVAAALLAALRWSVVTRRFTSPIAPADAIGLYWAASFVGQVLPSVLGLDALRIWLGSRRHKPLTELVSGVVADRAFGMIALALLILFAAPRLLALGDVAINASAQLAVGVLLLGAMTGFLLLRWLARAQLSGRMAALQGAAKTVLQIAARPDGAIAMALSVAVHLCGTLCIVLIAAAAETPLSFMDAVTLVPAAMLIAAIPISINGWGLREGAMIACLGLAGVPAGHAFAISVLYGIAQMILALPGVAYWVFARGRNAG